MGYLAMYLMLFFRFKSLFETLSSVIPFSSCLRSFPASGSFLMSRLFASGGPKYWNFSFIISPSNKYLQWISFRIHWFELLADQRTLKTPPTPHFKSINFQCLAFFIVQISHPYMTLGKTISLAIWTFVGKVMSLLFNILCRLAIAFIARSKCLLISWL